MYIFKNVREKYSLTDNISELALYVKIPLTAATISPVTISKENKNGL